MAGTRRGFLKSAAGLATAAAAGAADTTLPQVAFGFHKLSRLIVGCNQFYGYSHLNPLLSKVMKEWNTPERVCETLARCERNGITTWQTGDRDRALTDLQKHRAAGGGIQALCLGKDGVEETVRTMKPLGLAHHGEVTDVCFREGRMGEVHEFVKRVRQTGVMAGVSTHKPEVIDYIESKGWDVDYYMACAYHRTRTPAEFRKLLGGELPDQPSEIYLERDPERMCEVVRKTPKTCLLFKILAAGRRTNSARQVDEAFRFALANIKPRDCIIVGMFPMYDDEVKENADRVRRILAEIS
ncbi:MAG: hypothetical protein KIT09_08525 [Bryobacteraceae bacterium]|nr:hypothetical protein [Bryobacteraceae bacterium]